VSNASTYLDADGLLDTRSPRSLNAADISASRATIARPSAPNKVHFSSKTKIDRERASGI